MTADRAGVVALTSGRSSAPAKRFSPLYVIGFSQVIGVLAALVAVADRIDVMVVPEEPLIGVERVGAFAFAFVLTFSGAGYVALNAGHRNPIIRTVAGYAFYLALILLALAALWLTGIEWFVALPFLGLGLMLAIVLPPTTETRALFRIAIPVFFGALLVSFRGLSEVVWSIPTPDWTLTVITALLLSHWILHKKEASAPRSPQPVDPGPGPIRV
jgi:hypothetical protein